MSNKEYTPDVVSHPRETIIELFEEKAKNPLLPIILPLELLSYFSDINQPLSKELAKFLHQTLGPSEEFWLTRDRHYREYLEKLKL